MYKKAIRPLLFLIHPDYVHAGVVWIGSQLGKIIAIRNVLAGLYVFRHESLEQELLGIRFRNPVGLGGGFDKNAKLIRILPSIGFGFMEAGSITRFAYKGNKRPWSTRLPEDKAILVNYGLKNLGVDVIEKTIRQNPRDIPLVVNIAKTNDRSISGQGTIEDYMYSYRKLEPLADILNINISCPNTGDGVLLCENIALLEKLLTELQKEYEARPSKKPIVVKLKPDLSQTQLQEIIQCVKKYSCIRGFIISNLTKDRSSLRTSGHERYKGGLSGKPMREISTQMIREVRKLAGNEYAIVGCGGIFDAEDAYEKLRAGANLVELVTGLIYEGPAVIKKINSGLVELMHKDGFKNISEISRIWTQ